MSYLGICSNDSIITKIILNLFVSLILRTTYINHRNIYQRTQLNIFHHQSRNHHRRKLNQFNTIHRQISQSH